MKKLFSLIAVAILCISQLKAQVDFRKETIYFLLTTRFFDGDSTNNAPNEWCSYIPGVANTNITDPKDVTWRGDFKGLIQKLDYIKGMGFTAIWITPIVQNRGPLDYHGYHAWDFTKVDPRLESPGATFQDLVNAIHAKGMKIVLDIVTNHSGRYGIKTVAELKYNTDPTKPWGQTSAGLPLQDNANWQYDGLTPNPDDGKRWSRANLAKMPSPYNQNLAAYNWPCTEAFVSTSDENWFHHSGNGFVQGWDDTTNCYQRAVADDCPDLNTASQLVQDYMFNCYKTFIDMGVDAFRWDTWKHMNKQDILVLYDRFKAYKPDLFVFGEVAQKRFDLHSVQELNPHWYTWRGNVGSSTPTGLGVLDFYGEATFHNIFENGGAFSGVTEAARYDNLYSDPTLLITWLDNHDFGPNNDWNRRYGGSVENLAACMNFMFTWRGIPCVYYGTESQFMKGAYTDLHDASGIQRSLNETGRAYFGEQFTTASTTTLYKHFKKLNDIRKAIPALQTGNYNWAGNYPGNGIGFTRSTSSQTVAVGLAKDGNANFNFTGLPNGIYRDAVTGREVNVTSGNLSFTVQSLSAGVYVLNGPGMIGEGGVGYFESCVTGCNPLPKLSISPIGDNYTSSINVNISASGGTGAKTIYYTTNGTNPTTSSTIYTGSFIVNSATTIKAIAVDANGKQSDVEAQVYTFILPKPKVTINPAAGNYYNPINISFSGNGGATPYTFYYTTNGTNPTTSSNTFSSTFTISTAQTIKVIAVDNNNQTSDVVTASYTFNVPNPSVSASPASGNFPSGSVIVNLTASSPRMPVTIYYTVDGSMPTTSSLVYSSPFSISGSTVKTIKFFGVDNEGRIGSVDSAKYTFNPIPDIWIYFKKPSNWATPVKIHYWNTLPSGNLAPTSWPGINTMQVCANGNWWKYKVSNVTSLNVVFNDGAGKQTNDLNNITADSYFDYNTKLSSVVDVEKPIANLTITPTTGTVPLTVTLNATASTGCTQLGYFWNFGNGNSQQTGLNATTSQTYSNAGTYLVTLVVQDQNNKRDTLTQSITVNAASAGQVIHFKPPSSYTNLPPKIYYWNTTPTTASVTWPGFAMISEGNGWYTYTIAGANCSNIVFNNNSTPQTADLYHCNESWYDGTVSAWVNSPVSVKFLSYKVVSNYLFNTNSYLVNNTWKVAEEIFTDKYNLQRSFDGVSFETIATIAAQKLLTYSVNDTVMLNAIRDRNIFYRIECVEKDGRKNYSELKQLGKLNRTNEILIYPNPAKDIVNIDCKTGKQVFILNEVGQILLAKQFGNNQIISINTSKLAKGLYIIKIATNNNETTTNKLIVE